VLFFTTNNAALFATGNEFTRSMMHTPSVPASSHSTAFPSSHPKSLCTSGLDQALGTKLATSEKLNAADICQFDTSKRSAASSFAETTTELKLEAHGPLPNSYARQSRPFALNTGVGPVLKLVIPCIGKSALCQECPQSLDRAIDTSDGVVESELVPMM
jgi:hypothetical protein